MLQVKITKAGTAHALIVWWALQMTAAQPELHLCTRPTSLVSPCCQVRVCRMELLLNCAALAAFRAHFCASIFDPCGLAGLPILCPAAVARPLEGLLGSVAPLHSQ